MRTSGIEVKQVADRNRRTVPSGLDRCGIHHLAEREDDLVARINLLCGCPATRVALNIEPRRRRAVDRVGVANERDRAGERVRRDVSHTSAVGQAELQSAVTAACIGGDDASRALPLIPVTAGVPPRPPLVTANLPVVTPVTPSLKITVHDTLAVFVGSAPFVIDRTVGAVLSTVTVTIAEVKVLPALSVVTTRRSYEPSGKPDVVFQVTPVRRGGVRSAEVRKGPVVRCDLELSRCNAS